MRQTEAAHVAQFDPLEVGPEAFTWIQLRGISREALEMDPVGSAVGQKAVDHTAAMNRGAIPDDDHRAGHLAPQVLETGDNVAGIQRMVLAITRQFPLGGDGANGREMIASPPFFQDRRVPPGRIGADDAGEGIEARFIDEKDALPLRLRPLWIAGQVSWRQRTIAASSR